jgi:hypothetical protein
MITKILKVREARVLPKAPGAPSNKKTKLATAESTPNVTTRRTGAHRRGAHGYGPLDPENPDDLEDEPDDPIGGGPGPPAGSIPSPPPPVTDVMTVRDFISRITTFFEPSDMYVMQQMSSLCVTSAEPNRSRKTIRIYSFARRNHFFPTQLPIRDMLFSKPTRFRRLSNKTAQA